MKKTLLLLFVISLFVVSCQGPIGQEGPQGGTNTKIINLVANSTDWVNNPDPNGKYYSVHYPMSEITPAIFNDGAVIVYYLDDSNVQQPLPYVRHFQNTAGNFTRTVDFDYSLGNVNVYVTNSDFAIDPPIAMKFRVVILW